MKSIAFCITSLERGGAERQLYLTLNELSTYPLNLSVIAFFGGYWEQPLRDLGISVTVINAPNRLTRALWLFRKFRQAKPDIVHCFGSGAGFWGRAIAVLARVPKIIASERYVPACKGRAKIGVEYILGFFSDYVTCNSRHACAFYSEYRIVPAEKIVYVPNILPLSEAPISLVRNADDRPVIGYLANFRHGKNHEYLLRAFAPLAKELPHATLVLGGFGVKLEAIKALAVELGIDSQVKFLGQVLDTQSFFRSLTHYCHISEYEGVPNSLMEAMSFGLPCVVSDIPGNRELILDHINGLLVSLDSPIHLTTALRALLAEQDESRKLGEEARRTVFKTHQPRFTVEALLPIYVENQADIQSFLAADRRTNIETRSDDKNGHVSRSAKG